VMNFPESVTEHTLREMFSRHGTVNQLSMYTAKERRMAVVAMGSVPDAIEALVNLNLQKIGENHTLRVSFTKSVAGVSC